MMAMKRSGENLFRQRSSPHCLSILMAFALSLLAEAVPAQQVPAPAPPSPGVEIKIQAHPSEATIGDPIQIDFDFSLPRGYRFRFPELSGQIGEFTVLETYPGPDIPGPPLKGNTTPTPQAPRKPEASATTHHRARIVVAVYKTGDFDFPALPFALQDPDGKESQVSSPEVKIRITSVLAKNDLNLRDLKQQADIEEPSRWLLWMALGTGALAAVLLIWWWIKRRRRPPAPGPLIHSEVDPLDQAEADLRSLIGQSLQDKGAVKQFYVRLADIMKRAVEAGYGIQTVEKTTMEIVAAIETSTVGGSAMPEAANQDRIEFLLLACDMVKFARYIPSPSELEEVVNAAFDIIGVCRARRAPEMSGAAPSAGVS
jgi:hypothetical protein